MNIPADLKYSKEHEWVKLEENIVTIGITDYAQEELGDIVNVELPEEGDVLAKDEALGSIESVKASSEVFTPVSGKVSEINEPLFDTPELLNEEPYDEGWMIRMEISDPTELDELMSDQEYQAYLDEETN